MKNIPSVWFKETQTQELTQTLMICQEHKRILRELCWTTNTMALREFAEDKDRTATVTWPTINIRRPYGNLDVVDDMMTLAGVAADLRWEYLGPEQQSYVWFLHEEALSLIEIMCQNFPLVNPIGSVFWRREFGSWEQQTIPRTAVYANAEMNDIWDVFIETAPEGWANVATYFQHTLPKREPAPFIKNLKEGRESIVLDVAWHEPRLRDYGPLVHEYMRQIILANYFGFPIYEEGLLL